MTRRLYVIERSFGTLIDVRFVLREGSHEWKEVGTSVVFCLHDTFIMLSKENVHIQRDIS